MWPEGRSDEGVERNSLSAIPGAAFHAEPGPDLIKERLFQWAQEKITFLMALSGRPKWHVSLLTQGLWCWGHFF